MAISAKTRVADRQPSVPYPRTEGSEITAMWHDAEDLRWAVRNWAARIGVKPPQIHVRQMSTKWASVSTAGRLTLSSELLDLPRELGEFVVVHELVHVLARTTARCSRVSCTPTCRIGKSASVPCGAPTGLGPGRETCL